MVSARIPELEKCMFCCTLRTGALIIAAASVVLCGLLGISSFLALIRVTLEIIINHKNNVFARLFIVSLLTIFLIAAVLEVFSIFLWIGIKQYKQTYVLSWAIITTAFNLIQFSVVCFLLIFADFDYKLLLFGVETCMLFYVSLVVYSYYREMRQVKNTPQVFRNEA